MWDIYGNPLRRGHCEVHPHVREEYPCIICRMQSMKREENKQREREYYAAMQEEHNREMQLAYEIEMLDNGIIAGLA